MQECEALRFISRFISSILRNKILHGKVLMFSFDLEFRFKRVRKGKENSIS